MARDYLPLFILEGNGPCGNHGCEALLRSTIQILRREFESCRFLSCSGWSEDSREDPQWIQALDLAHLPPRRVIDGRFSLGWWHWQLTSRIMRRTGLSLDPYVGQSTAVLALGGDLFTLDYGRQAPNVQFAAADMVLRKHKPMIIWGASISFAKDAAYERFAMEKLRHMTLVCVRETVTRDYLAEQGISDNVRLAPDPAFTLAPEEPVLPEDLRKALEGPCLGLNLSPLLGRYAADRDKWLRNVVLCLHAVDAAVDMPIVLIPHVVTSDSNDHEFLRSMKDRLSRTRNPWHLIPPEYSAPQLKWILSRLTAFVGTRMHSTIGAISSCVPTLTIGYSVKSRGLNKDIFGHIDWLLPVDQLTPDILVHKIHALLDQGPAVRAQLASMMPAYIEAAWTAGRFVREAIDLAK